MYTFHSKSTQSVPLIIWLQFNLQIHKFFLSCQPQTSVHLSLIFCHAVPPNRGPLTKMFSVDVFNWLPPSLSQTPPRILNAVYPPGQLVFVAWLISSLFFIREMNLSWKPSVQLRKHVQNVGLPRVTGLV